MVVRPRDHSEWWIDQRGRRWSNFGLWRAERSGELRELAVDSSAGVRVVRTSDDEVLHMVRYPGPEVPVDVRSRALLSDADRELLAEPETNDSVERDRALARIRWRLSIELAEDLRLLRTHEPALYDELRTAVLAGTDDPTTAAPVQL